MMSNLRFRDRVDSELENIEFTAQSRQKVLERAGNLQKRTMNPQEDQECRQVKEMRNKYAAKSSDRTTQRKLKHGQIYGEWLKRINRFLETELRISVKPLVVALLITLSGLVYSCIGVAGVSAEEMQKSSITVVDSSIGGQADELYKD